ncbi:MAG TPA: hypothetical protein VEC57_04835 [Candidatus Limnocylindrales bacterium]|nr:hypothetical protein [Candidatus Limnocylindrales bacterium]
MSATRKIVLVAGAVSPDRTIALERLLRREADNTGWSDRLEIRLGGIGAGAGHVSDAGEAALRAHGIDAAGAACPDLERRRDLFDGATMIVTDSGQAADTLVDWDETADADFVSLDELGGGGGEDAETAPGQAPIAQDVDEIARLVTEVLRRVVATPAL